MSRSLGTLTLDLIAKVGGFTGPLDQASRTAKRRMGDIQKSVSDAAKTVTTLGAAATGMAAAVAGTGVAVVAFTNNAAQGAKELTNMAALANTGVEDFQRWSYAANSAGIEQGKLGDILKDVNDRVGDFITTGGGEMADFFEQIAPKVGVTAEQFRKLSGAQGLQLYYDSLQKAGLSQQEITFYMESMADEATALAPLLADNGKQLKAMAAEADNLGIVLSEMDVAMLGEFADQYDRITSIMGAMSDVVAAELAPYLSVLGDYLVDAADGSDGLAAALPGAIHDSIAALGPLLDKFRELQVVDKQFKLSTASWDLSVSEFAEGGWRSMSGFFDNVIAGLNKVIQAYNLLPGVDDIDLLGSFTDSDFMERQRQQITDANAAVIAAQQELGEVLSRPLPSDGIDQYLADVKAKGDKLREEIRNRTRDGLPATGSGGTGGGRDEAKEAAKRADALERELAGLKQQADQIGMNADAIKLTELATLGASDAQLKLAQASMATVEAFEAQKEINADASAIIESLRTEEEAIEASYDRRRETILAATELTEQARTEAMLRLEQERADSLMEINGGYWERYLEAAAESLTNFDELAANTIDQLSTGFGSAFESMIFDAETFEDAMAGMAEGMMRSVVNAIGRMMAEWLVYEALKMAGITAETTAVVASESTKAAASIAATTATTAASTAATATTTATQVAAAGTTAAAWLPAALVASIGTMGAAAVVGGTALIAAYALLGGFQEGGYTGDVAEDEIAGVVHGKEFVMNAAATRRIGVGNLERMANGGAIGSASGGGSPGGSDRLDHTLGRVNSQQQRGGQSNVTVNLIEDRNKAGQVEQRQREDGSSEINAFVTDIGSGGERAQMLEQTYGLQRRGR
ncbi:hypothetical protein GCM10022421_31950 [Oceanisphaera sediminis]|uniref:Bacteriophage tail tape measure C-terminal domain-containing protein n=1 Tax=Oceanisphaera sediminis TaxID=981381 RepID=A0ABP7ELM2_9GAMM